MKVFKDVRAYIAGKGIVQTDVAFDEKIHSVDGEYSVCDRAEWITLPEDCILLPGFIDEHIHGAGGAEISSATMEDLKQISRTLAKSGTTAFLATTVSQSETDALETVSAVHTYMQSGENSGAEILGVHLEGPFLAHRYKGGMVEENLRLPNVETFDKCWDASGKTVKMITLAPELDGAETLIKHVKNLGVTVSVGHSEATYKQVQNAREWGATGVTHTYNAQSPLHHREIGVLGSALLEDELVCELIADTVHVSVPAMQLLVKNKPKNKVVLITDSLRAQGLPQGRYESCGQIIVVDGTCCRLENGTLAGTVVPMNGMVQNVVEKVGVPFLTAVDFATINPAVHIGVADRKGSIEIGKDADFCVLNSRFETYMTVRGGEIIYLKN